MYRLLSEIYKIPCLATQQALIKCTDSATLTLLQTAFPKCLVDLPPKPVVWGDLLEQQVEIDYSLEVKYAALRSTVPYPIKNEVRTRAQWRLWGACEHFGIPIVAYWHEGSLGLPKNLLLQLREVKQEQPLYLEYGGKKCLVVEINFYELGPSHYEDEVEDEYKVAVCDGELGLVDADCVVFPADWQPIPWPYKANLPKGKKRR